MNTFQNPVVEGFSPDPSVCRVGDDYYLVTSTFAYFPGVPIYHSKDLVNWTQIGNVLDREEQLNVKGIEISRGIFAPTIRYHEGTFYMITTNVTDGGNFVVTATDPAGPWSNPYFIDNAPGIDPSLFFDDDGKVYYCGTRENPTGAKYNGDWEVWLQEFDLETMQLTGVATALWKGALHTAIWPEAPHIYKKDGYYYLLIAEGGTGFNHACTVARSERIDGAYIGNKNNPILTHRHLGNEFPVQYVGHADFVDTPEGDWYLTCLAVRPREGHSNLGRETFLAEVVWEDGWPVVNPGVGQLMEEQEHKLPLVPAEKTERYDLTKEHPAYLYLRNPDMTKYDKTSREGWLRTYPSTHTIHDLASPTYLGLRQEAFDYTLTTVLEDNLTGDAEAGLVVTQSHLFHVRLVVKTIEGKKEVQMIRTLKGEEEVLGKQEIDGKDVKLVIKATGLFVDAFAEVDGKEYVVVKDVDVRHLSTESAGGFVGCTMGLYTTAKEEVGHTDFEYLELVNN